jgi:catechol 2,3-dioxygenase-like lactoylglutathione lyase family enzyme
MLSESEVMGFIPTKDATKARAFYEGQLGLLFISDDPFALVVQSRETIIRITKVQDFTPFPFTILGWRVQNIEEDVRSLSSRGVPFQRFPGLDQNDLGIWTSPDGTKVAWFKDPDGNVLSVSQHLSGA